MMSKFRNMQKLWNLYKENLNKKKMKIKLNKNNYKICNKVIITIKI